MTQTLHEDLAAVRHEAQRLLREQFSVARQEALLDTPGGFDQELWTLLCSQGWPGVGLPESLGGAGLGWPGLAVLSEEIGRVAAAVPLLAGALAASLLDEAGKSRWLAGLIDGSLRVCVALPGLRMGQLDVAHGMRSVGDRLHGDVCTVAFAAVAELALVAAMDEQLQASLWLVELDAAQVMREPVATIDDARAVAHLRLDGARGLRLSASPQRTLDRAAVLTAFEQLGGAQACLTLATGHALQREAFGQPIARFQGVKHKLVEIYSAIEIARGCALAALEALDGEVSEVSQVGEMREAAAAARVAAGQAYEQAARDCINTFGALGLTREAAPHRHYRRARSLALELGSASLWRESLVEHFIERSIADQA